MAAACGEAGPLDGVGELSARWLQGASEGQEPPGIVAAVDPDGLAPASGVVWFNEGIEGEVVGDADEVVAGVWARRGGSRFVQASPREIAAALPTIRFPSRVPPEIRWITSQLVFDEVSGGLDVDTSAAFGFWLVEPYTASEGRSMVLRVGQAPADVPPVRSDVTPILVPEGVTMLWTEGGLRYELFCRATVPEDHCLEVARSTVPLVELGGTS